MSALSQPNGRTASSASAARIADDDTVSIGELAKDASTQLSTIIRGEIELAKSELTFSFRKAYLGAAFFGVAAIVLIYSLTFGLIAAAEGIHAGGLPRWAAYLIVFGALVVIAIISVLIGIKLIKKVKAPERTIETTKQTAAFLKHPTKA